jgi:hypothetical protein
VADDNQVIKFALIGVGAFLLYEWLQSSGMWAQIFGGANSFTTPATLLAYCQANPAGSASYGGQTAACSAWMQAAGGSASAAVPAPSPAATGSTVTPAATVTPLTVAQLLAAAGLTSTPNATQTVDEWNYYVSNKISPTATVTDLSAQGIQRGVNDSVTAAQYIALRQQAGLSGLKMGLAEVRSPYAWVN